MIEKIECKRVATGIDNWSKAGIAAVGGFIAGTPELTFNSDTLIPWHLAHVLSTDGTTTPH